MDIDAKAREIALERDPVMFGMVKAALLSVRNEALEEAARVAENSQDHAMGMPQYDAAQDIATAIRALSGEPTSFPKEQ